jgi:HEAT repeat protein
MQGSGWTHPDSGETVRDFLHKLDNLDPAVRWRAVRRLETECPPPYLWYTLYRVARRDPNRFVRLAATYTLAFGMYKTVVRGSWLLRIYRNLSEHPSVRAQAAEGLANHLGYSNPRKPLYRHAEMALIAGLRNQSSEVRFWSAFALRNMRSRAALPELRRLMETDTERLRGWWGMAEEAADAIVSITGEGVVPIREMEKVTLPDGRVVTGGPPENWPSWEE